MSKAIDWLFERCCASKELVEAGVNVERHSRNNLIYIALWDLIKEMDYVCRAETSQVEMWRAFRRLEETAELALQEAAKP